MQCIYLKIVYYYLKLLYYIVSASYLNKAFYFKRRDTQPLSQEKSQVSSHLQLQIY